MADERPIEKLLRRYAKKRRDDAGAPMELHPATRRLLQGEVSRQFPKPDDKKPAGSGGWLATLRQRWIYATAAVSAVVVAVILVNANKHPEPSSLAQNQAMTLELDKEKTRQLADQPEAKYVNGLETSPAPTAPEPQSTDNFKFGDASARASKTDADGATAGTSINRSFAKTPAEDVAPSSSTVREETPTILAGKKSETSDEVRRAPVETSVVAAAPATPPPASLYSEGFKPARKTIPPASAAKPSSAPATAAAASPAPATRSRMAGNAGTFARADSGELSRNRTQELSRSYVNNAKSQVVAKDKAKSTAAVLTHFQIEQEGNRLRVIDADGSTYLGELEVVTAADRTENQKGAEALKTLGKNTPQPTAAPAQNAQNYFYRVAGTNRTLNQNVVFAWNFVQATNVTITNAVALGGALNEAAQNAAPSLLNNSGVSGRAQVDDAREIPIEAEPSRP